jgi:hypothetical protein
VSIQSHLGETRIDINLAYLVLVLFGKQVRGVSPLYASAIEQYRDIIRVIKNLLSETRDPILR